MRYGLLYECANFCVCTGSQDGISSFVLLLIERYTMRTLFRFKSLAIAIASVGAVTTAHAAALDRSGQDISAFLQDGTYAEAVYTHLNTNISGHDNAVATGAGDTYTKGAATGNIVQSSNSLRYGVKTELNDILNIGVLYDEPFGASVAYTGDNNFVSQGGDRTLAKLSGGRFTNLAQSQANVSRLQEAFTGIVQLNQAISSTAPDPATRAALQARLNTAMTGVLGATGTSNLAEARTAIGNLGQATALASVAQRTAGEGTKVDINTQNMSVILGAKLGSANSLHVYGGASAQRLTGEVHLRGMAYQGATGYDARISPDQAYGWLAGIAYSKPEIALKAALTYRSAIEHDTSVAEVFPVLAARGLNPYSTSDFKVKTPESYNLDFQTGVNPTTLLTAKVRYVPWTKFAITPPAYGNVTASTNNGVALPIASYSSDQWSAELGVGKKFSDKISVSGNVGWDSGAGNPTSSLGPVKGYYSVGLGAKYNINPEWSISAGGKYLMFGDASAALPNGLIAGKFADNNGYAVGVKLAYHAK